MGISWTKSSFAGSFGIIAGLLLLACGALRAQQIIKPPFGVDWGDPPEKLITWASRHSLDLNILTPGDQSRLRIVKVQSGKGMLPGSPAAAVEGKFLNGGLYEMSVHYTDPEANADEMEKRFENLRKKLTREQGAFLPNQQQRVVNDNFVTRTKSFHREPIRGVFLLMAWTEVEDLLRQSKVARFSLVYRNDNYRDELRKMGGGN
ncbi:MAG: hypothetical protein ACSHX7_03175 [Luteolibacter sp.]